MNQHQTPDNSCPHCGSPKTDRLSAFWTCKAGTTQRDEDGRTPLCREREAHNKTRGELAKAMSMIDRDMECEAENQKLRELLERALKIDAHKFVGTMEQENIRHELNQLTK